MSQTSIPDDAPIRWFLSSVTPMIDASEHARLQVARNSAPYFSSFKFLSPDENGLSDIIAHFLNPEAEHGQGTIFLDAFLDRIGLNAGRSDDVSIQREAAAGIGGGFIDILIETPKWRVVIENKPWAGDQPKQLERYWKHATRGGFDPSRCRMIYLSPNGAMPSSGSLGKKLLNELSAGEANLYGFSLGPIADDPEANANYPIIALESLLREWISFAKPAHVRGFLDDFRDFLNNSFGEAEDVMQDQSEALAEMIRQNRDMTAAALRTADASEYLRESVRREFFEALEDATVDLLGNRGSCTDRISTKVQTYRSFRFFFTSERRRENVLGMFELYRNGTLVLGVRAPGAKASGYSDGTSAKEPVPEEIRDALFNAAAEILPNARKNAWFASYVWLTDTWPNLNSTDGILFMYDALNNRGDPLGPISVSADKAVSVAQVIDQFFAK